MNRRDFHRAAAGASLASLLPSWLLPPTVRPSAIDLSLFCDRMSFRYDVATPFVQRGATWATDGRIALKLDWTPAIVGGEELRLPNTEKIPCVDRDARGWRPIDTAFERVSRDSALCPRCYGRGKVGPGLRFCELDACKWCIEHGEWCPGYCGGAVCPECEGETAVDYAYRLDGGDTYAPAYVARLQTVAGCEVRHLESDLVYGNRLLAARFPGGVGVLMPLREE